MASRPTQQMVDLCLRPSYNPSSLYTLLITDIKVLYLLSRSSSHRSSDLFCQTPDLSPFCTLLLSTIAKLHYYSPSSSCTRASTSVVVPICRIIPDMLTSACDTLRHLQGRRRKRKEAYFDVAMINWRTLNVLVVCVCVRHPDDADRDTHVRTAGIW
jgi:hypothetical protein